MITRIHKQQNIRLIVLVIATIGLAILFGFSYQALAQVNQSVAGDTFGLQPVAQNVGLGTSDIRLIIAQIIRVIFGFLGILALGTILYAGYMIMTSGGSEDKVAQGKKIMINATIGLAIILSALAIVQFIISQLSAATGFNSGLGTGSGQVGGRQTFTGSGALGRIVQDHYPFRDATDVARNTRIAVTFRAPVDPTSFITDDNNSGIFGDCLNLGQPTFDWSVDCDRIDTTIIQITASTATTTPIQAAVLATYVGPAGNEVYDIVLRPLSLLGSDTAAVRHAVLLTGGILKQIPVGGGQVSAFINDRDGFYLWNFETGTTIDTAPPTVIGVYPTAGQAVPRNSILQVTFSEPVDPSLVQGLTTPNSAFYNVLFSDPAVTGEWRITNGYRTIEFVSDQPCGQNSCGEMMYCLPVTCVGGGSCQSQYDTLIRTAQPVNQTSFEGVPGSGVMDMAGNGLDGDADGNVDGKPTLPNNFRTVRLSPNGNAPYENAPDNYYWTYAVDNVIDRSAPHIVQTLPGIDDQNIPSNAPVQITFSRPMWLSSMGGLGIIEHGLQTPQGVQAVSPLWFRPQSTTQNNQTITTVNHRMFGPNNEDAFYFTFVSSTVKSITQNCLYPGRGPDSVTPGASPLCNYQEDANGVPIPGSQQNCTQVSVQPQTDTSCVQTTNPGAVLQPDVQTCLGTILPPISLTQ